MSKQFIDLVKQVATGWNDKTVDLHSAAGRYFASAKVQQEILDEGKAAGIELNINIAPTVDAVEIARKIADRNPELMRRLS